MLENKILNCLLTKTTETIIGNLSESLITEKTLLFLQTVPLFINAVDNLFKPLTSVDHDLPVFTYGLPCSYSILGQ